MLCLCEPTSLQWQCGCFTICDDNVDVGVSQTSVSSQAAATINKTITSYTPECQSRAPGLEVDERETSLDKSLDRSSPVFTFLLKVFTF